MWIERDASARILSLAQAFPALIVTGARQTGKTSLLRRLFPHYHYVSLDLRLTAEQAEESPAAFLRSNPPPLLIDEVQYAPGLFRHLKVSIDAEREKKGQFILTGSQKFTLMKEVSDSLAGRCGLVTLPGLTVREIERTGWNGDDFSSQLRLLLRGAFPELWADPSVPQREYYQAYLATYLERDLREILNVGSLRDFERFMRACAARAGQLLNKSEMARDVGISQTTVSQWLSALEAGNQITLLEPFFGNVGKRLVKSPKLYFNDTGLLSFLLGLSADAIGHSPLTGAIWENFVLGELKKWLDCYAPEWTLWFYRDQQLREADFLIQGPYNRVRVLDAKWSELPKSETYRSLETVAELLSAAAGITETDVGVVGRMRDVLAQGSGRWAISGFRIPQYLEQAKAGS